MGNESFFSFADAPHIPVLLFATLVAVVVLYLGVRGAAAAQKRRGVLCTTVVFVCIAAPLCLLASHLLYMLLDTTNYYKLVEEPGRLLDLRVGDFTVYGAMLGWLTAIALTAKITGRRTAELSDQALPAGLLLLAAGRVAEGLLGQGISLTVENSTFCFFPLCVYDEYWEVWNIALFVPEALYALALLLYFVRRRKEDAPGGSTCLALFLYAVAQIWFESLRRDNYMRLFIFIRTMQLLSALLVTALLFAWLRKARMRAAERGLWFALHLLCLGLVTFIEFALEDKIDFLHTFINTTLQEEWVHFALCYGGMAVCVAFDAFIGLHARKKRI